MQRKSLSNYNEQEVIGIQKNDKKIWLKINGFPIFNEKSEFVGYRGVTHDITRHKQSEEDLRKSMAEIKTYQKQLKNLNSELIYTEDKERRRIAEYIHDSIGQTLSIAYINLSSLLRKDIAPDVNKTKVSLIFQFKTSLRYN
jgi:signal transduction histidine kinase